MAKESTFVNMAVCLGAVCLFCSALLGGVYIMTKDAIDQAALDKTNNAIALVTPEFDNVPSNDIMKVAVDGDSVKVYPAMKGGEIVGYAIETSTSKGFSGTIKLMVGFDTEGNIVNTSVISHSETPGLGAKMTEPAFSDQFCGKNPAEFRLQVKKNGGDVDAITASTITSVAFCDAVEKAYRVFGQINGNSK